MISNMDCYRCHEKNVECYRFIHKVYCRTCFEYIYEKAYELIEKERLP